MDCTPEVRAVELNPGDNAIVLATDGLWDVLSDVSVVELLVEVREVEVHRCLSSNSSSQQKGMQKCQCLYWLISTCQCHPFGHRRALGGALRGVGHGAAG